MLRDYDAAEETRLLREAVRAFPIEWFHQDEWRLLRQALGDLAWIVLGAAAVLCFPSFWVAIPAWLVIAARMHGLGVLMHDLCHCRDLRLKPAARLLLDAVICWPIMFNVDYYGHAHLIHHRAPNIPGRDPYFVPLGRQRTAVFLASALIITAFLPVWMILRLATYPLTLTSTRARAMHMRTFSIFGNAPVLLNPSDFKESERVWRGTLGPAMFWYVLSAALAAAGLWASFAWVFLPSFVLAMGISYVRLVGDHDYQEARNNSIVEQVAGCNNMVLPWWQEFFIAPHSATCHAVHHVVPDLPNWRLVAAHRRLSEAGSKVYDSVQLPGYGALFSRLFREQRQWVRAGKPGMDPEARVPALASLDTLSLVSEPEEGDVEKAEKGRGERVMPSV